MLKLYNFQKMFLGAENLRKDNTSPIFEGTSLDACIDEALDKKVILSFTISDVINKIM